MPKFGKTWFNGYYFGDSTPVWTNYNKSYRRIPLGFRIRKQLGKAIIFRNRKGNGRAGSDATKRYQDKYKYIVPTSINNPQGQAARDKLSTAVSNWKTVLTEEQKAEYNRRATRKMHMSGYNLYIREHIKGVV